MRDAMGMGTGVRATLTKSEWRRYGLAVKPTALPRFKIVRGWYNRYEYSIDQTKPMRKSILMECFPTLYKDQPLNEFYNFPAFRYADIQRLNFIAKEWNKPEWRTK